MKKHKSKIYFLVTISTVLFSAAAVADRKSKQLAGEHGGALGDRKAVLPDVRLKDKTESKYNAIMLL